MNPSINIREAWALAASRPEGQGLRAIALDGFKPEILATITDDGHCGLLVRVGLTDALAPVVRQVNATSIVLLAESFPFAEEGRHARGFHLWCTQRDLQEAFAGFCEAFIQRVRQREPINAAFLACYTDFKRLIASPASSLVPVGTIGLLGELIVLADLLILDASAVDYWAFPDPERHDFRHGKVALEIKTTLRREGSGSVVGISSLDQLEPPDGGELYLQWLRLERDVAGPYSIELLTNRILSALSAVAQERFSERLSAFDMLSSAARARFSLEETCCFHVGPLFPRLTRQRLLAGAPDAGVSKISYQLDLSAAAAFSTEVSRVHRNLLTEALEA